MLGLRALKSSSLELSDMLLVLLLLKLILGLPCKIVESYFNAADSFWSCYIDSEGLETLLYAVGLGLFLFYGLSTGLTLLYRLLRVLGLSNWLAGVMGSFLLLSMS